VPVYATSIPNISQWCKELIHPTPNATSKNQGDNSGQAMLPEVYHKSVFGGMAIKPDTDIQEISKSLQKQRIFRKEATSSGTAEFPCVVKLYGDKAKLNDLVIVTGILDICKPPATKATHNQEE